MIMSNNSSSSSPPPPPPPPPLLQLFPLKPSILKKEEEIHQECRNTSRDDEDFKGRKQEVEEDYDKGGFTNLGNGLGRNPLLELSLSLSNPPVVLGRRKREEENPLGLMKAAASFIKRFRNDSQSRSKIKEINKKGKRDQDLPLTSKQTCSSSTSQRPALSTRSDHNDEQENVPSSSNKFINNSTSTPTHKEQRIGINRNKIEVGEIPKQRRTFLFEKTMTAIDIGDFNRLLIPFKYATDFFPKLQMTVNGCQSDMLKFTDNQNCNWDMKYEYWMRSQSYVLTKGWKTFVTHHKLQFNDVIRIYKLADDGTRDAYKRYGIDFYRPMRTIRLFGQDISVEFNKMDGIGFVAEDRHHSNGGEQRNQCPKKISHTSAQ